MLTLVNVGGQRNNEICDRNPLDVCYLNGNEPYDYVWLLYSNAMCVFP